MEILTAIIAIVVGVLQIVLFFKLWAMTNDVKSMKKKMRAEFKDEQNSAICMALLKGDKQKAIELLTDELARDLTKLIDNNDYSTTVKAVKEEYAKKFKKLGVDELPIIEINNRKDIEKLMY